MSNSRNCIGVVGVGVMGEALLAGVINSGIAASSICIADKRADRLNELQSKYGVNPSNIEA
ncbi:MAG: NAD(P)-binding domain-containing protein, partial [Acidobacteria bacterium]|nr:NAD(P)-binding domain-containing protein [Acidobacteriota bacterium]